MAPKQVFELLVLLSGCRGSSWNLGFSRTEASFLFCFFFCLCMYFLDGCSCDLWFVLLKQ